MTACRFPTAARARLTCEGSVPWAALTGARSDSGKAADTLTLKLKASGDLLASFEHNVSKPFHLPIAGSGAGTIEADMKAAGGSFHISSIKGGVARGTLRAKPYVLHEVNDFSFLIAMDKPEAESGDIGSESSAKVTVEASGTIDKRPMRIFTSHAIPRGLEALRLGILDAGVVELVTPRHGVNIHLPGLMEPALPRTSNALPKFRIRHLRCRGRLIK